MKPAALAATPERAGNRRRDFFLVRFSVMLLVAATTATASVRLWAILQVDGLDPSKIVFLLLFVVLFGWISASFWIAATGTFALLAGNGVSQLRRPDRTNAVARDSVARTAIVMPICNEDAEHVFAGVEAMAHSLAREGAAGRFDFYILSDTRGEERRAPEQAAWLALRQKMDVIGVRLFYRRRLENSGRKAGNIADFLRNWGSLYRYMIVLDADSLMSGGTLVALEDLMDANPRAGLIQVPPVLAGRRSLYARLQQFASSVYGPIYSAGLATLQGREGNYYGHNAILRIAPFMHHCGLPELPGRAPLGGDILSHDFVEAALLAKAGWEVHLAHNLGGSYEEPPPTFIDHLKRDRRWCQGNLQHIRFLIAQGFKTSSRMHFFFGIMSYLSAPLWLLMLVASSSVAYESRVLEPFTYIGRYPSLRWPVSDVFELAMLALAALGLLFGPKFLALFLVLRDRPARRAHGGALRAIFSVILECIASALIAPIAMLSHCGFIASILSGACAHWSGQRRREHFPEVLSVVAKFAPHTLVALAAFWAIETWLPESVDWFAPLLLGAALAIPIALITSSSTLGAFTRSLGLFLVPSETVGLEGLHSPH